MRPPLDFTFDGDDGEVYCLRLSAPPLAKKQKHAAADPRCVPPEALLASFAELAGLEQHSTAHGKAGQLLGQWLSLPTTESLFRLVLSNARREVPLDRAMLLDRKLNGNGPSAKGASGALHGAKGTPPVAPAPVRVRWSVTGATPHRLPPVTPKRHRRRKSEPTLPSLSWLSPSPTASRSKLRATDLEEATLTTPSRSRSMDDGLHPSQLAERERVTSPGALSNGTASRVARSSAGGEAVLSPLSYFGNLSSRHESTPSSFRLHDGTKGEDNNGLLEAFTREAGGTNKLLSVAALQRLSVEHLDLPKAVARLLAKRAQQAMPEGEREGGVSYAAYASLAARLRKEEVRATASVPRSPTRGTLHRTFTRGTLHRKRAGFAVDAWTPLR